MTPPKTYAIVVGVVLIALGLLGFVDNPIVGDATATSQPIFVTGAAHNMVHLITGAVAIYVAFGLLAEQQALAITGLGLVYVAIVLLTLVNGTLFGVLGFPVNAADQLLNVVVAVSGLVVGIMGSGPTPATPG
jgi:rRNA processing protein Krr1/Pno1